MLKTYFFDVKDGERALNRFEVRLVSDHEAILHSKELAAALRHRRFPNQPGLIIAVLDQSNRKFTSRLFIPKTSKEPDPTARVRMQSRLPRLSPSA